MPSKELLKTAAAVDLPLAWDNLAEAYFQQREFLHHCERFNPCHQRYYMLFEQKVLKAGAVVYTLQIDLLTFSRVRSPVKMQVIGLPASVSAAGVIGSKACVEQLLQLLLQKEKGLLLGVNLDPQLEVAPGIAMPILPNVELELPFSGWGHYLRSLRSPYRRRLKRTMAKFEAVQRETTPCSAFSGWHYKLYRAILKRTPNKLETLPEAFFRNLPPAFRLTTYRLPAPAGNGAAVEIRGGTILCWSITCREAGRFYFFFGGMNYDLIQSYDSYFNNLFGILQMALAQKCTYLDLGQTAEVPKMRLGGQLVPKQMFLYHRNPILYWALERLKPFIRYKEAFPATHVFKKST